MYNLAERTEDASRALAEKRELKTRVTQIQKDFEEEQQQTFEMRQDMTRQYKGMQEELLTRVCIVTTSVVCNCRKIL